MTLEHVAEVGREREVDVEEVRHVDDVVDDLAAVSVDSQGVPGPVRPLIRVGALDPRDGHLGRRHVALRVVPHEQLLVLLESQPGPGARRRRHPARVRDLGALAVAAPVPVMKRAGDRAALDRAAGQVAAHVPAVRVQDMQLAGLVGEYDELGAERFHRVRTVVAERRGQPEAMPATGEPGRRGTGIDAPHSVPVVHQSSSTASRAPHRRLGQGRCP